MQLSRPFFEVKDIDTTGRVVQFYGSAFGNEDSDGDIMMPGCYAKTIQENGPGSRQPRIKHLRQHRTDQILGAFTELKEDARGLLCTSTIAQTKDGDDALALYALNLYEHSVGFQTLKSEWDETDPQAPVRRIKEVKLWEVSSVTWGANADTPFVGFKSHDPAERLAGVDALNARLDKLMKALRTGNLQDSTYLMLEAEADQLKTAYKGLISLNGEPLEPASSRPLIIDTAEGQKGSTPDVPKAKEWLKKAIDLHEKHMNGTVTPDAASQKTMMTQMKSAMTALGGTMAPMKATPAAEEPSGKKATSLFLQLI